MTEADAPMAAPRKPRILVTNDDGIHAPGLQVAERIARSLSDDVWIVAPETNQSGASHSLTLKRPLRTRSLGNKRFAIDGTPTDCVLLALLQIIKGHPVDLVISGVNEGGNLAEDITYSGTVAAAMEAALFEIPSFALSQVFNDGRAISWDTAERFAPELIAKLFAEPWPADVLINMNFPACGPDEVQGHEVTVQGRRQLGEALEERFDPRGQPYVWIGRTRQDGEAAEGTDLRAIAKGIIALTPVHLDRTHLESFERLRKSLG